MSPDETAGAIAVFDLGGTWFRWGRYAPRRGLLGFERAPAISHVSHPTWSAADLQAALTDFIVCRTQEMVDAGRPEVTAASVSVGAAVHAFDATVLGSGPLWGPTAKPFRLHSQLCARLPELKWHVINDITALLAPYMEDGSVFRKTLLLTISTGVGARLYDHRMHRIPYDANHGVQGEIGHLVHTFELAGQVIHRCCECGGWDHLNAFASGRGMARTLLELPTLGSTYAALFSDTPADWAHADDAYRLGAFQAQLDGGNRAACDLLEACVTPVSRTLALALSLDPDIDRIVITGGVAQGLGEHYHRALTRAFVREGLYQITCADPDYLTRRLQWAPAEDCGGLRGAGLYAELTSHAPLEGRNR